MLPDLWRAVGDSWGTNLKIRIKIVFSCNVYSSITLIFLFIALVIHEYNWIDKVVQEKQSCKYNGFHFDFYIFVKLSEIIEVEVEVSTIIWYMDTVSWDRLWSPLECMYGLIG